MKNKSNAKKPITRLEPSDSDIRCYAYHLYSQSSGAPGHDVEDWLEARACLAANIPLNRSRTRLHRHVGGL